MRYFKIYANKVFVKGEGKSAIYNFPSKNILFVPNPLTDFANKIDGMNESEIVSSYSELSNSTVNSYINFLLKENIGFYTSMPQNFSKIDLGFNKPFEIFKSSIEITEDSHFNVFSLLDELDELGCRHLELRILYKRGSYNLLCEILDKCSNSKLRSITIISKYPDLTKKLTSDFIERYPKVTKVIAYNADKHSVSDNFDFRIEDYSAKRIHETHVIDLDFFAEAQKFNPYYNQRICISDVGQIKNCLNLEKSYGLYGETTLKSTIEQTNIKHLWSVSPDKILDLRSSELRYAYYSNKELVQVEDSVYKYKAS